MPSTFTNNTGIELIADGEQTGAWGQRTNDNFDIVDRALNGSVSIALSGTTGTVTTGQGSTTGVNTFGQFAVLVFTGSPSGTNTVTIAPNTAQKTYFVTNSTAETVVLTQGSGANVTVPAGLSKIVFTDGGGATAAVFDITNTLAGNLTGNVTGNVTGNAGTATAWQTARTLTINGVGKSVDGTANVAFTGPEVGSVPSGGIIMWVGSIASIPAGWLLCDGANGTPDLRDRFIVGAGSGYAVGEQGGLGAVSLTEANLPAHTHTFSGTTSGHSNDHTHGGTTSTDGAHTHTVTTTGGPSADQGGPGASNAGDLTRTTSSAGDHFHSFTTSGTSSNHTHTISGTTGSTGSGTAHENRPPYLALAYIMKT